MINKNQFSDAMSGLDVETVERYLRAEQACLHKKAKRRRTRILAALVAAVLALAMLASFAIVPLIPKTYDLNYEFPKHQLANKSVQIYYATESGELKNERVKLPDTENNVFLTWKHLNTVGDEVQLLGYTVHTEEDANTAVVPNTLWDYLAMQVMGQTDGEKTVTATLSPQITSYENYDALIESLIRTIAKYAGIPTEQVKILIDGEGVVIPGISGRLLFSHSLMDGNAIVVVGSTLDITVTMTNLSNEDIEFTGSWGEFVPGAILTMGNTAVIKHEDYDVTQEYQTYTLAPGQSREMTYTFPIPEGATCGEYDLLVSYGEDSFTFEKAVHVVGSAVYFDPDATIEVNSPYDDLEHFAIPYDAECAQIVAILNSGDWQTGEVLTQPSDHYALNIYDSAGMHDLYYSAEAGVFQYGDYNLRISDADMNTVNEIFAGYAVELPE